MLSQYVVLPYTAKNASKVLVQYTICTVRNLEKIVPSEGSQIQKYYTYKTRAVACIP